MDGKLAFPIFAFSSLLLTLAISGCVNPGSTSTGNGVIIQKTEVDFQKVYAGENFKLQTLIKNTGSVKAEFVIPKMYNVGTMSSEGKSFEILCSGDCDECVEMIPPDPERGTDGESRICTWDCTAPKNIPKGMTITFNPSVRLYYFYRTSTTKAVTIVSQDELRSIQNQGTSLPSETLSTTSSPVQMDVIVNGPIRYWQDNGQKSKIRFPININIENTGGGTACAFGGSETAFAESVPDNAIGEQPSETGGTTTSIVTCDDTKTWNAALIYFDSEDKSISLEGCDVPRAENDPLKIDLWKGKSKTITCEVTMDVNDITAGFVQKNLQFTLEYGYFVDSSASVQVMGRESA